MCEQQYFLQYNLSLPSTSNKSAEKGTIVHKVMECLARAKKSYQEEDFSFVDDAIGEVTCNKIYTNEFVNDLYDRSYKYYSKKSDHDYENKEYEECNKWVWKALDHKLGAFDPRNLDVVDAEPRFDFELPYDWANYEYQMLDGTVISGKLRLKGTIDLIVKVADGVYESIDWKTGQRKCWATGDEKTFYKLSIDPQLRIYHFALHNMYPEVHQFIPTIYYINHGGPFTFSFGDEDLVATELMIKKRFEEIKATTVPTLLKGKDRWKCTRICHYGKNEHESGEIDPNTSYPYTICAWYANKIRKVGLDAVIDEHMKEGVLHHYEEPGT